jgi:hypothetical protein
MPTPVNVIYIISESHCAQSEKTDKVPATYYLEKINEIMRLWLKYTCREFQERLNHHDL